MSIIGDHLTEDNSGMYESTPQPLRIVVEVVGGCVTSIFGDPLPIAVEFIVRDMDSIETGDVDPLGPHEKFENAVIHY
jgi:hypothetical protein